MFRFITLFLRLFFIPPEFGIAVVWPAQQAYTGSQALCIALVFCLWKRQAPDLRGAWDQSTALVQHNREYFRELRAPEFRPCFLSIGIYSDPFLGDDPFMFEIEIVCFIPFDGNGTQ